jgi:hypothetical protein
VKATIKDCLYLFLSAASLLLLAVIGLIAFMAWEHHLPSDQTARQQFEDHRGSFVRFAALLRQDPRARIISESGVDDVFGKGARVVPEYGDLMRSIGAKAVYVRPDGSVEFQLWGFGCVPCADSFKGVRFQPEGGHPQYPYGGAPIVVSSLMDGGLPQNRGAVADGLYVVPLDREWSIYRLEISD